MKISKIVPLIVALFAAIMLIPNAHAHDYELNGIEIIHPWARASAGAAKSGAAFMVLSNETEATDRLVAVTSPVAKKVGMHTTKMEDGIMKMRPLEFIEIPADDSVELAPGGHHIMLMGLIQKLEEGTMFPLILTFEKAGTIEVMVKISGAGDMDGMGGMDMDHGD